MAVPRAVSRRERRQKDGCSECRRPVPWARGFLQGMAVISCSRTSPRQKRRRSARGIDNALDRGAVKHLQPLPRQNGIDFALSEASPVAEQKGTIGGPNGVIGIVGHKKKAKTG